MMCTLYSEENGFQSDNPQKDFSLKSVQAVQQHEIPAWKGKGWPLDISIRVQEMANRQSFKHPQQVINCE